MSARRRAASRVQRGRRRRARRLRRATTVLGLVLLGALAAAALTLRGADRAEPEARESPAASGTPTATAPPEPPEPPEVEREPDPDAAADASAEAEAEAEADPEPDPEVETVPVPETGPGTFRTASGDGEAAGQGTVHRYQVQVEDGIELDPEEAGAEVHAVLAHQRGWTRDGATAFERVGEGEADFIVRIATPGTVDHICGQYGLDTGGQVNCRVGEFVMVNLRRWVEGSPRFDGPVQEYRALIINHEVGHFLGHGHEGCPAPGAPAPAMMQQIKGLDGCEANAWPYDEDGSYLSGPPVP